MAAGKIDMEHSQVNSPLKRNIFTSCGPFSFVRRTKQVLEEVQEKKENLYENLALELRTTQNLEFYEVIDSLPENEEVFEVLRIKQLVRDSIQSADKEIQDLIKLQLKNENKQNVFPDSKTIDRESDTKHKKLPSSTSLQSSLSSSLLLKQNSKSKPVRPNSLKCFVAAKKKPIFEQKRREPGLKGNHRFVINSAHASAHQQGESIPQVITSSLISDTCAPEDKNTKAQFLQTIAGDGIPRNATLLQKYKSAILPNFNIRNCEVSGYTGMFSEKSKYFPSAVPLAPPSRQKSLARAVDSTNEAVMAPNNDDIPKRCNVAVVTVQSHEVNTRNLKCQALPSMSIEGKPKNSSYQRNNVKNILFQEELSEGDDAFGPGNPNVPKPPSFAAASVQSVYEKQGDNIKLKHCSSDVNSSDSRRDSKLLLQDKESHVFQEEPESKIELEEKVITEILENLILEVVHEGVWNICCEVRRNSLLPLLESSLPSSEVKEVLDVETQIQNSLVELVDQEIQTSIESPQLISECIQTSLSVKQVETASACVQVSHTLEPTVEKNESPSVAPAMTGIDVSVQTSLEVNNMESRNKHESLPNLHSEISSSSNASALDLNPSLRIVTAAHDVSCSNGPALSFQDDSERQKFYVCTQLESAEKLLSPNELHVLKPDEMTLEHNPLQTDLDMLPQKEKRSDEEHQRCNSEQSLSEKISGATLSASTTITDSDFMEDLISEGECILHSHLRLLSLIGRNIISTSPKRNQGKEAGECSLSEGEIPIRNFNRSADSHINFPTTTLTGYFEESVPVKLTSGKSSVSSNGTFCGFASNYSEGEVRPHYTTHSSNIESHCLVPHGEDEVVSVEEEREFGSHPVLHHL